jgi:polyhydroxybutyrate depolymerase
MRMNIPRWHALAFALTFISTASAQDAAPRQENFHRLTLTVEGLERTGFYYAPPTAKSAPTPLVFIFHGHGGSALNAARQFQMHRVWPEAISVYLNGLPTPGGGLVDPEGKKPGWVIRAAAGENRDLKLFDAALAKLRTEYQIDPRRIHATGHSNGGFFTYLLWAERGALLASVAPSAAVAGLFAARLEPKPVLHLAGEKDSLVKYENQQRTIDALRRRQGCAAEGRSYAPHTMLYPSAGGTPVAAFIHPGAHGFPEEGRAVIAQFFREHPAK